MPQPDNRRERGAKTQTSQQTVAPQGQMPGTISPISGGAAAAAPVLQIGQQAQIKKTGAELYQAIAGVAQGVQQGIKNYEQMYSLVSETEYADFETSYIKENERVKGDPTKMKTWMDAQTYKPNRVTAKRYHSMKAQVNQKSYEEEQSDELAYLTRHMSEMTNADALEYANSRIGQYDENSPVAKGLYDQISKLQGAVVAQTQRFNDAAAKEAMIAKNRQIVSQLHDAGFPDSTSSDEFQMVLAAVSLGQATIDTASGSVTVGDRSYMLNALPENMPDILKDTIGNAPIPSLGVVAIAASKLPQSDLNPNGRAGGGMGPREVNEAASAARNGLRNHDTGAVRASFSTVTSDKDPDKNYQRATAVGSSLVRTISQDPSLSPAEKIHQLTTLSTSLGLDGEDDPWLQSLGIDDEAGVRSFEEVIRIQDAIDAQVVTGTDQVLSSFGEFAKTATNKHEYDMNARNAMVALSELAVHGGQEAVISAITFSTIGESPYGLSDQSTKPQIKQMNLAELQKAMEEGVHVSPLGISIIDPDIPEKVPFGMELTESGLITTGSLQGSNRPTKAQLEATEEALKAQEEMRLLADMRDPKKRAAMGIESMQRATDRLAATGDKLFAFVADNVLPSGAISEAGAISIANSVQEVFEIGSEDFFKSEDKQSVFYKQKLADLTTQYPAVLAHLKTRDRNGYTAIAAQYGPHITSQEQVFAIAALQKEGVLTAFDSAGGKLETALKNGEVPELKDKPMEKTLLTNAITAYQKRGGQEDFAAVMADPEHPSYELALSAYRDTVNQFSTIKGAIDMGALSEGALIDTHVIVDQSPSSQLKTMPNSGSGVHGDGGTTAQMDAGLALMDPLLEYIKEKNITTEPWTVFNLDEKTFNEVYESLNGNVKPGQTSPEARAFIDKIQKFFEQSGRITSNGDAVLDSSNGITSAEFNVNLELSDVLYESSGLIETAIDTATGAQNFFAGLLSDLPSSPTYDTTLLNMAGEALILPTEEKNLMGVSSAIWEGFMDQMLDPNQRTTITRTSPTDKNNPEAKSTGDDHLHQLERIRLSQEATKEWNLLQAITSTLGGVVGSR